MQSGPQGEGSWKSTTGAILNKVNMDVTQDALIRNVNEDLLKTAEEESLNQVAEWEAAQKQAKIEEKDEFDDDDFDDDEVLAALQKKRMTEMQKRAELEKQFHSQGHGEYREIVEEDFLKEVCGSLWVVVHFYHREFFRCKVVDKHLKVGERTPLPPPPTHPSPHLSPPSHPTPTPLQLIAPKHLACKFLYMDAEKAPFFVTKLAIRVLPTVVVFKDGKVEEQFSGFEDLGGRDDFRTEVLEHWLSKAGCIVMKKASVKKLEAGSDSDVDSDSDDE